MFRFDVLVGLIGCHTADVLSHTHHAKRKPVHVFSATRESVRDSGTGIYALTLTCAGAIRQRDFSQTEKPAGCIRRALPKRVSVSTFSSGAKGTRTPNPLLAKQVRYQLRHGPSSLRDS